MNSRINLYLEAGFTRFHVRSYLVMGLILFTYLNIGTLFLRSHIINIPVNPIVFFIIVILLIFNRQYALSARSYFLVSFLFLSSFGIIGVLALFYNNLAYDTYNVIQTIFKLVIAVLGIPYVFIKYLSKNEQVWLLKVIVYSSPLFFILMLYQYYNPLSMSEVLVGGENEEIIRPAALWINGNVAAFVLISVFLISFLLKPNKVLIAVRALLVLSVFLTLSRTNIVILFLLLALKLVFNRQWAMLSVAALAAFLFIMSGFEISSLISNERVQDVTNILSGDTSSLQDARVQIWTLALDAIGSHYIMGLGVGSMARIVNLAGGLGPHNFYIWLLGNAGIFTLGLYLVWLFNILRYVAKPIPVNLRFILTGAFFTISILSFTSHSVLRHQSSGVILGLVVFAISVSEMQLKGRELIG